MITCRQHLQMALQVRAHLLFGLFHKSEADRVPQAPGQQAQAKGACVPQGIEQGRASAQFLKPLRRPGKVVGLLRACFLEMRPQLCAGRGQRLRGVQGLRAHLPHVVDTHQANRASFFVVAERWRHIAGGTVGVRGMRFGKQGAQRRIGGMEEGVHQEGPWGWRENTNCCTCATKTIP